MDKPVIFVKKLDSGRTIVRFDSLSDLYWYDEEINNPNGISIARNSAWSDEYTNTRIKQYKVDRNLLSQQKLNIVAKAKKSLSIDKDFIKLIYKAKSEKRGYEMSKFGGILSMPRYSRNEDKMFKKSKVGEKKSTLNMAFQVGTMLGGDYQGSFIAIIKTVLMAQALKISLNIDMFDSDYGAPVGGGYVICNVAKSTQKLNFKNILACSHQEFFNYSLFNGYSGASLSRPGHISGFLSQHEIVRDLSQHYDIIGGNMLRSDAQYNSMANDPMVSSILKIAWR